MMSIKVKGLSEITISTIDLNKGLYFVEILNDNEVFYTSKVMKSTFAHTT